MAPQPHALGAHHAGIFPPSDNVAIIKHVARMIPKIDILGLVLPAIEAVRTPDATTKVANKGAHIKIDIKFPVRRFGSASSADFDGGALAEIGSGSGAGAERTGSERDGCAFLLLRRRLILLANFDRCTCPLRDADRVEGTRVNLDHIFGCRRTGLQIWSLRCCIPALTRWDLPESRRRRSILPQQSRDVQRLIFAKAGAKHVVDGGGHIVVVCELGRVAFRLVPAAGRRRSV